MRKMIAPSILSADFGRLSQEIKDVTNAGADWIHLDVMDGHFVPNISFGAPIIKSVRSATHLPFDVHLMISDPDTYIPDFAKAGADYISFHAEASTNYEKTIELIRSLGVKPGIVINPDTPITTIESVLHKVDYILCMSVYPGFGGQSYIPEVLQKITSLVQLRELKGLSFFLEVDGGVNISTMERFVKSGADIFVAGSAVFGTDDYRCAIKNLTSIW